MQKESSALRSDLALLRAHSRGMSVSLSLSFNFRAKNGGALGPFMSARLFRHRPPLLASKNPEGGACVRPLPPSYSFSPDLPHTALFPHQKPKSTVLLLPPVVSCADEARAVTSKTYNEQQGRSDVGRATRFCPPLLCPSDDIAFSYVRRFIQTSICSRSPFVCCQRKARCALAPQFAQGLYGARFVCVCASSLHVPVPGVSLTAGVPLHFAVPCLWAQPSLSHCKLSLLHLSLFSELSALSGAGIRLRRLARLVPLLLHSLLFSSTAGPRGPDWKQTDTELWAPVCVKVGAKHTRAIFRTLALPAYCCRPKQSKATLPCCKCLR